MWGGGWQLAANGFKPDSLDFSSVLTEELDEYHTRS